MRTAIALASLVAASLAAGPALADYPERPIDCIVPYSAGGGTDIGVRTWQPYMEKCIGGTIVVINRPGAGAVVRMAELAGSAADGYTLGGTNTPNVYTTDIAGDVPYTLDSFAFLGTLIGGRSTIVVREDSPIKSIADLIEHAKANNGEVKVGLSALGGDDHFMLQQVSQASGLKFSYIPMSNSPTIRAALMGGHIDITAMSPCGSRLVQGRGPGPSRWRARNASTFRPGHRDAARAGFRHHPRVESRDLGAGRHAGRGAGRVGRLHLRSRCEPRLPGRRREALGAACHDEPRGGQRLRQEGRGDPEEALGGRSLDQVDASGARRLTRHGPAGAIRRAFCIPLTQGSAEPCTCRDVSPSKDTRPST